MVESAHVPGDLSGRLAVVEHRRLERENRRLTSQVGELTEQMARLRAIQRLEGQLLEREKSLRADILRGIRDLLSDPQPEKVEAVSRRRIRRQQKEIPSFLRSAEALDSASSGLARTPTLAVRLRTLLGRNPGK